MCGIAAARYLSKLLPASTKITIVTAHGPASYTSSLSTECYRDHWPSAVMRDFMGRSISLLHGFSQEAGIRTVNRGYLYVSSNASAPKALADEAQQCHGHTPGAVRTHGTPPSDMPRYWQHSSGADVFTSGDAIRGVYPWLSQSLTGAMHARNAGWVPAQTMGMTMLDELLALKCGDGSPRVRVVKGWVTRVDTGAAADAVRSVTVAPLAEAADQTPQTLSCGVFVNASGPYLNQSHCAQFIGGGAPHTPLGDGTPLQPHALPVFSEVHSKVIFRDTLKVIPRDAPMTICNDPLKLSWSEEELEFVASLRGKEFADRAASLMPAGAHFRPYGGEGSDAVLMLWEAWHHGLHASEPPVDSADGLLDHDLYPEVVLRGLAQIVPDLAAYLDDDARTAYLAKRRAAGGAVPEGEDAGKRPVVDGGYYTKTHENVPLIGPAPGAGGKGNIKGSYICGAVSGYGIMAAHAAGELLAAHVLAGTADGSDGSSGMSGLNAALGLGGKSYATLMSPLRYQWPAFTQKGGWRDQLLASGGGQL